MKKSLVFIFMLLFVLFGCSGNDKKSDISNKKDYTKLGKYSVNRYPANGLKDKYVVYYPKDGIREDMPVVVFLEGGGSEPHIDDYKGVMKFLASKGYYVIGLEQGETYWSSYGMDILKKAINEAKSKYSLTLNKIAVLGHSQGGGQNFYIMKQLQDMGYGSDSSLILSFDAWFAFGMDRSDLAELRGDIVFLQMNGLEGTGTDPRIELTIWNLASNTNRRFYTLPENNHSYVMGTLNDMISKKKDLIKIVSALTEDSFNNTNAGSKAIKDNLSSYELIKNALKSEDSYKYGDCAGVQYNAKNKLKENDIDYCALYE